MYKNDYFAVVSTKDFAVISSYTTKALYTINFREQEMKFSIDGNIKFSCGNIATIADAIFKNECIKQISECSDIIDTIRYGWKAVFDNPAQYQYFVPIAIIDALGDVYNKL